MKLLQGTILCLLLSSLCSGLDDAEVKDTATPVLSSTSATKTSVPTSNTTSSPNVAEKSTVEISAKGATSKEPLETSLLSTLSSVTTAVNGEAEIQSSIKATETPVNTLQPDASPSRIPTLSSISVTILENISQSQGIILPVVIALIAITLSVFALVGLYRMCWKTDPGTPENGNDQPQSDKESVKLLTVKTISHESGLLFSFCAPRLEREKALWIQS
ncbi:hypothetical protein EI555_021569 [Monodon monoceros]|uniref:Endomucin n=1 Tax=Monodon monoceros TaxID=40151 RepID=A0A4U1EHN6_MONMO|nr:hypothetical protein EI555_021569 [Monodon monoceros]